ncbi:MAG: hypothetical protein AAF705_10690, partial [Bacteroidota bacterium]
MKLRQFFWLIGLYILISVSTVKGQSSLTAFPVDVGDSTLLAFYSTSAQAPRSKLQFVADLSGNGVTGLDLSDYDFDSGGTVGYASSSYWFTGSKIFAIPVCYNDTASYSMMILVSPIASGFRKMYYADIEGSPVSGINESGIKYGFCGSGSGGISEETPVYAQNLITAANDSTVELGGNAIKNTLLNLLGFDYRITHNNGFSLLNQNGWINQQTGLNNLTNTIWNNSNFVQLQSGRFGGATSGITVSPDNIGIASGRNQYSFGIALDSTGLVFNDSTTVRGAEFDENGVFKLRNIDADKFTFLNTNLGGDMAGGLVYNIADRNIYLWDGLTLKPLLAASVDSLINPIIPNNQIAFGDSNGDLTSNENLIFDAQGLKVNGNLLKQNLFVSQKYSGGDGLTQVTPFSSIDSLALSSDAANNKILLGDGEYLEFLPSSITYREGEVLDVEGYYTGNSQPIVAGYEVFELSQFDTNATHANVLEVDIAGITINVTSYNFILVEENDDFLLRKKYVKRSNLADVAASPGSYHYTTGEPKTIYIHPYEDIADGVGFRITTKENAFQTIPAALNLNGITARGAINGYGPIASGFNSNIQNCIIGFGGTHSTVIYGGTINNCLFEPTQPEGASDEVIGHVFYAPDAGGEYATLSNSYFFEVENPFYAHTSQIGGEISDYEQINVLNNYFLDCPGVVLDVFNTQNVLWQGNYIDYTGYWTTSG